MKKVFTSKNVPGPRGPELYDREGGELGGGDGAMVCGVSRRGEIMRGKF